MSAKVIVNDLRKRYGAVQAVSGVDFRIEDGEIFGLIGPNGAGKTTTVECVIGLREPDEGAIEVCGIDARRRPREVKEKIGAALQTTSLQDKITPREALALFGSFYRRAVPPTQLLERFALGEKADVTFDTLSGGQRQRLALALAFVNNPELVFLDEPTSGLDPQSRRELHGEIAKMKNDGHTVLLTTHYLDEAEALCDRIAIIDHGHVIATGSPRELISRSQATQSVTLVTSAAVSPDALAQVAGLEHLTCDGATARFDTQTVHQTLADLVARLSALGVQVQELHVQKATLEDVFIELHRRGVEGLNVTGLLPQLRTSLQLYFRNKMALIYGYLFPTIFLIAFWVLYRYDRVPLVRHMGELLTVAVLGGACFGLPTTMVSDRERGVWRRYRLTPVPTGVLVVSTLLSRYLLLITAGLLQVVLAMAIGMPLPRHPLELWVAFTFVSFAFLGLGLVIATMADNVPAVQALGQCIFLPMLIIGGVAVQLGSLPEWAQHVSAFFPGRYAVEAIQATVNGNGLGTVRFSLLALLLIGATGALTGAKLFRWDAQQRFAARSGKAWLTVALAAWAAIGLLAERHGRVVILNFDAPPVAATAEQRTPAAADTLPATPSPESTPAPVTPSPAAATAEPRSTAPQSGNAASPIAQAPPAARGSVAAVSPATPSGQQAAARGPAAPLIPNGPPTWQAVTPQFIDEQFDFTSRMAPDSGVVTPIARLDQEPDPEAIDQLDAISAALPDWAPGKVADPVQRVRNLLYVPSVVDVFQLPSEPFVPRIVFDVLQERIPKDDLIKLLFWVAIHPYEGDDSAVDQMATLGMRNGPGDMEQVRDRAAIYGVKLLGRLLGKIEQK